MSAPFKHRLLATVAILPDASPGGITATAMRYLASAAPSATGCTLVSPDGTARYISRADAEVFVRLPKTGEARQ